MESQVSELSPVLVELKVQVPWERVNENLTQSYATLSKTARVKGFRPGKVPKAVLQRVYGKRVHIEVAAHLMEECLIEAVRKHSLDIVSQPEISTAPEIATGEPLAFTAKIEVRPTIDKIVADDLVVERERIEIEDEAVNRRIEMLRHRHSEVREPDPIRPVQAGDELVINYTVSIDGVVDSDLGAENRPVTVGEGLLPEIDAGLRGMVLGQEKAIEFTLPDDHPQERLRSKVAQFNVTIKELRERILPELDDEFAKDCGDYATLLELRLKTRESLEAEARAHQEMKVKESLIDALIKRNEIPIPPSMLRQQEEELLNEFRTFAQMTGQPADLGAEGIATVRERAERRTRAGLLLGGLARQEQIRVTDADLETKYKQIAEKTGKHVAKVKVDHQSPEKREQLETQILESKLMDFLMQKAKIVDVDPKKPETDEGSEQE